MTEKRIKLVTRQQPHIETLQVSVQVVRIGPKQMTQSVFRQLQNETLIDWRTGELRGIPWGTVNYFWGDCVGSDHLHLVWQRGDELRRSCVPRAWPLQHQEQRKADAFGSDLHLGAYLRLLRRVCPDPDTLAAWRPTVGRPYRMEWGETGVSTTVTLPAEIAQSRVTFPKQHDNPRQNMLHGLACVFARDTDIARYTEGYPERLRSHEEWCAGHLALNPNLAGTKFATPPEPPEAVARRAQMSLLTDLQAIIAECRKWLDMPGAVSDPLSDEQIVTRMIEIATAWKTQRDFVAHMQERWQEHLEAFADLPQLFIAV